MKVAIIGGGPAGLMAAETLLKNQEGQRFEVHLYDAMPSLARKFLLAGKGGLNLTHTEPHDLFVSRYGPRQPQIAPLLEAFGPQALRDWAQELGITTFVGSSGRVFPTEMKAAPLLRAWLHRLRMQGLRIHVRHRWQGWSESDELLFDTPSGQSTIQADAVLLALGGGSWPRLGSNGQWCALLQKRGITIRALRPANCGFDVAGGWSAHLRERFAGQPLKSVTLSFTDTSGHTHTRRGECLLTETGLEGSLIYALSASLRDTIEDRGSVTLHLDLMPDWPYDRVLSEVKRPRGARSLSSHLQSRLGLKGLRTALLREAFSAETLAQPEQLAHAIKSLPLKLYAPRPLSEAISSAGGVDFEALDPHLMLKSLPGVFCAGEMLDWEAPTGGYLLTACLATGRAAGLGARTWLNLQATTR